MQRYCLRGTTFTIAEVLVTSFFEYVNTNKQINKKFKNCLLLCEIRPLQPKQCIQ